MTTSPGFSTATLVGWATALVGVVFLWVFPPGDLESFPPLCVSQWLFDFTCWGCGMVRAFSSLLRAQFEQAWSYNWRVYIVVPILLFAGIRPLWRRWRQSRSP